MHSKERRSGEIFAVEADDGSRVECDGILGLLDQFCTLVKEGYPVPRAILVHLAGAFDQVLRGQASADEALGIERHRSGPRRPYRGRLRDLSDKHVRATFWRQRRLAAYVRQFLLDGHKLTEAYRLAAEAESRDRGCKVSIPTCRRAWKAHGEETHAWIQRLEPARRVLTMAAATRVNASLKRSLPRLEREAAKLQRSRRALALEAARACGEAYGRIVGTSRQPLVVDLLWDDKQLLGPRQYLGPFLRQGLLTQDEAKAAWLRGYKAGAKKP